jgi:hypothetical protein
LELKKRTAFVVRFFLFPNGESNIADC